MKMKSNKAKCCMLPNLAGEQAVEVYNTLTYSEEEEQDDPAVLMEKFEAYCNPKRNITYERHLFNTRMQIKVRTKPLMHMLLNLDYKQKTVNLVPFVTN